MTRRELLGGAALVGMLAVRHVRDRRRGGAGPALRTPVAALAVGVLVLGFAATVASSRGQRQVYPLRNVLEVRVLPYPERVRWFADHGMPQAEEFVGDEARRPFEEAGRAPVVYITDGDPDLRPWFAWLAEDGRATFTRWLATHPWYVLDEPFRAPERFPIATQNAARVFWWLAEDDPARAADWAHAGLRAYFTRGVRLDEREALRELCAEAGLDPDAAEAAWNDPRSKQRLKAENDAAIAAGVFGAPSFFIDGEMFWGNDRKPQIERWLAGGPF